MVYGDTRNAYTERSSYFYDQPSHTPSVSVPAQRCHSPPSAGQEAWEPISADAQMEKQAGINWEMRATLLVLLCFCLCKEEEMFVKPISQNGLPLTAGGPAKPPAGTFCLCTRSARVNSGTFAEYHLSRKKTRSVFNCVPTPIADCSGFFSLDFCTKSKTSHPRGRATSFTAFADRHSHSIFSFHSSFKETITQGRFLTGLGTDCWTYGLRKGFEK